MIRKVLDFEPQIGEGTFVAETAAVIGDVVVGKNSSIWYGAVLRGDVNKIRVGNRVSIQDGCCLQCADVEAFVKIGDNVTIGHNATLHGCKIGNDVLIGMGSTLLDNCQVASGSIVAAGALVLSKTEIGPNELWGGVPAKFIKKITPDVAEKLIERGLKNDDYWTKVYLEENK